MKKLVVLIIFILIVFSLFLLFTNGEDNYSLKYDFDSYSVEEKYYKEENRYRFTIKKDNVSFDYIYDHEYDSSRKLVNKIEDEKINDYKCIRIKVFDKYSDYICEKEGKYYTYQIASNIDIRKDNVILEENGMKLHNIKKELFLWDGYGLKSMHNNKEYHFIKNESYDNKIYYQIKDKILFADYDSNRDFSKFYIFDLTNKKIKEFKTEFNISFDSYFNGNKDNDIYLFDRKNGIQYKINIDKLKIEITSNKDGGYYYDKKDDVVPLSNLKYKNVIFNTNNKYNYIIKDNTLYYYYFESNNLIKVSNLKIDSIVNQNNDMVYYLSNDALYRYSIKDGEELVASLFEWNFSSKGKIFVNN